MGRNMMWQVTYLGFYNILGDIENLSSSQLLNLVSDLPIEFIS